VQCTSAAVLFYKNNFAVAITGNGRAVNRTFIGYTLLDSDTGDLAFLTADVKSKRFKVEQPDHSMATVQVTPKLTRTVLQIKSGNGEGLNARGGNVSLDVGGGESMLAPNTFIVSGCDAYVPSGLTNAYLFEYHGGIVYDKTDTVNATKSSADLPSCTDQARQILTNKGYTEE
jgi:hypothetical protein